MLPPPASPPFSPPGLPSSPPPCPGTSVCYIPQDWWDWIAIHHQLASHAGVIIRVTNGDVEGVEGLLLV